MTAFIGASLCTCTWRFSSITMKYLILFRFVSTRYFCACLIIIEMQTHIYTHTDILIASTTGSYFHENACQFIDIWSDNYVANWSELKTFPFHEQNLSLFSKTYSNKFWCIEQKYLSILINKQTKTNSKVATGNRYRAHPFDTLRF